MSILRSVISGDAPPILFLIVFPFVYFWRVTLGQGVWFTRDISRLYYPFAVELSRALSEGRLPLWVPDLQIGFPLVAEGQVAAFYLPHLILLKLMSPEFVISFEMLLHLAWAAVGTYACVRGMGWRRASALLAGFSFSFCGYMVQKLYHTPILLTAAWLPWLIYLQDQFQRAQRDRSPRAGIWFLLTTFAAGIQWFIGFPQSALMNTMTCAAFGFFGGLFWNNHAGALRERWQAIPRVAFWTLLPLLLSGGVAAVQIVPTTELIGYSMRSKGLSDSYINAYPLPKEALAQFVIPFAPGEPSDDNVEYWGYVGLTVLVWAAAALALRHDARTIFYFAFALVVLSLSLGERNPIFWLLTRLPIFNYFRVPARYLLLFSFGTTFLCATTFEALTQRVAESRSNKLWLTVSGAFGLIVLLVIGLAYTQSLDFWFPLWQVLPWILGALALMVIGLAWARRIERGVLSATMIGLVVFDLSAYAAPFLSTTVAALTPPAYVNQVPHSVPVLGTPCTPERVFTDQTIWPSVPALRSSLYPNFGAVYGWEMAHAYTPLLFDAVETYIYNQSPAMFNLLNIRYFLIPLEPRLSDRPVTPDWDIALDVVANEQAIPATPTTSIQVESFTEDASSLPEGSPVAEVIVTLDDGTRQSFPLRVGIETADWDYGLQNKGGARPPSQAHVARTVPAFLRAVGTIFDGYVYQARFDLAPAGQTRNVVAVTVQPLAIPRSRLAVERVSLIDDKGRAASVAALTGKTDFALTYMSDTVAIWENLDMLPRAFLVHRAEVMASGEIFDRLHQPGFRGDETVLLQEGQPLAAPADADFSRDHVEFTRYQAENLVLQVTTDKAGYLVLVDSWYPGWNAFVDGKAVPIYRADSIFRAIPIEPGRHQVVFEFRPMSLYLGAAISAVTLLVTLGVALAMRRRRMW